MINGDLLEVDFWGGSEISPSLKPRWTYRDIWPFDHAGLNQ
jgi:hypothetical protein